MKKAKFKFILLIIIVLACYVGNVIFYNYMKLDTPYFLNHQYSIEAGASADFYMMANANTEEEDKIRGFSFEGLPFIFVDDNAYQHSSDSNLRKMGRRLIVVRNDLNNRGFYEELEKLELPRSFDKVQIFYGNGRTKTVPIGNITFEPRPQDHSLQPLMKMDNIHYVNDETVELTMRSSVNIELLEVEYPFDLKTLDIYVGDKKIDKLPVEIKPEDQVKLVIDYKELIEKASKEGKVFAKPMYLKYDYNGEVKREYIYNFNIRPDMKKMNLKEIDKLFLK